MKKIASAMLGLALLSGSVVFAQNTSTSSDSTMKSTKKAKHHKSKSTMSSTDTTSSPK